MKMENAEKKTTEKEAPRDYKRENERLQAQYEMMAKNYTELQNQLKIMKTLVKTLAAFL